MRLPKEIAIGISLILAANLFGAYLMHQHIKQLHRDDEWIIASHAVQLSLQELMASFADIEAGERGYIITGDEQFLAPYRSGSTKLQKEVKSLKDLLRTHGANSDALVSLNTALDKKIEEAGAAIAARQRHDDGAAQRLVASGATATTGTDVRALVRGMLDDESHRLSEVSVATAHAAQTSDERILGIVLLDVLGLVGAFAVLRMYLRQRNEAQAVVAAKEQLLSRILDAVDQGVFGLDQDGRTTFCNARAADLTGWPAAEVLHVRQHDLIHHSYADGTPYPRDRCLIYNVLHNGIVQRCNVEVFWRKDGTSFPVEYVASPLRVEQKVSGAVVVFNDITERRRMEVERENLLQLEKKARTEAERASRAKDEFLANLSHELRTPLTSILGWATMLEDGNLDAESTAQAIATIKTQAEVETKIVADLIDVSDIASRKLAIVRQPVDFKGVIEQSLAGIRLAAEAKHVYFMVGLPDHPTLLQADGERLGQLVGHLLANAVKFSILGGEIEVILSEQAATVQLVVRDHGIGLAPEHIPLVFDRFWQADATNTRSHGGLGVGLYICQEIAHRHGGQIRAESSGRGLGATFTLTLPREAP